MATARHFSMLGIYSEHHNLPTNEMSLKSDNAEFLWYCGDHFEHGDRRIAPLMVTYHYVKFYVSHFQNGHHNTAQIQHCPIPKTFHIWVDYDVPHLFQTLKIF
jgi:hypothetical protein